MLLSSGSLSTSCCCGHAVHLLDKHINKAEKLVNIKRLNDKINSAFYDPEILCRGGGP